MTMTDKRADTTQSAARFDVPFLRYMTSRVGGAVDYEVLVQKLTSANVDSTNTFDGIEAGLFSLKMYITLKYSTPVPFFDNENVFTPGTLGVDSHLPMETGSWVGNRRLYRSFERLRSLLPSGRVGHQETLGELRIMGLDGVADRLSYLMQITEGDPNEPRIQSASLLSLAQFLIAERWLRQPRIGVGANGLLQIEWILDDGGMLAMLFLVDGYIQFAATAGRVHGGTESIRVNGVYQRDEMLKAIQPFTRGLVRK